MRRKLASIALILVTTLAGLTEAQARQLESAPVVYTAVDLGSLAHSDPESCYGDSPGATITDVGVGNRAVGSVYYEGERAVAAFISAEAPRTMVSGPGGGRANAINSSGQIAGTVYAELPSEPCGEPTEPTPVTWDEEFDITPLELPEDSTEGSAVAINADGSIAGWVETGGVRRAALWSEAGLTVISHAPIDGVDDLSSEATAINDAGLVSGNIRWSAGDSERSRAFVWDGATVRYLDPLIGVDGAATAINNAGVVSGYVVDEAGVQRPVFWWRGQIVELGPLVDRPHAIATDINNAGFSVGYGARDDGLTRAMIWIGGMPFDLNDITQSDGGWQLQMAVGINDDGVIAGWGDFDGERRAFLLVPAAG